MVAAAFMRRVTGLVDGELESLLARPVEESSVGVGHRQLIRQVKTAVSAHLNEHSAWHRSASAIADVAAWTTALRAQQDSTGLFSGSGNLASPPDSSFTVNDMAVVRRLVSTRGGGSDPAMATETLRQLGTDLDELMVTSTPALLAGGVHTANHRWELAAALAQLDALRPQPGVRARLEVWLAEGVDVDQDGLYSERSPNYAARVTNPCLLGLAGHLDRPDLLAIVHRNLHAHAPLIDVDGRVETVHSRRQDQGRPFSAEPFALQYRRFALLDGCQLCAQVAARTDALVQTEAGGILAELLLEPALAGPLPASEPSRTLAPGHHVYGSAGLVKVISAAGVATIYGGSDAPRAGRIASGLACDPTFLRWRHGEALLDSVRLSRNFFGLGPFRGDGVEVAPSADQDGGSSYRLQERLSAAYYQPLEAEHRRSTGDYPLEFEGRFASAMGFTQRHRDEVHLQTQLLVSAAEHAVTVQAEFLGAETSFAVELAFWPGGVLEGVRPLPEVDCYELVDGFGSYRVGEDTITFGPGPGSAADRPPGYDPGESYTFVNGTDAKSGPRVYLTGRTPGRFILLLRGG